MADNNIQIVMQTLFKKVTLSQEQTRRMCKHIQKLVASDLSTYIFDYYKNQILSECMLILHEEVNDNADELMSALSTVWNHFYMRILPVVQLLLFPVNANITSEDTKMNTRDITLVAFRDMVLLKSDIYNELHKSTDENSVPAPIRQMLLVLQTVQETCPPNANYLTLEVLLALTVRPYLGYRGLYDGHEEPVIKSRNYNFIGENECRSTYKQHQCRRVSSPTVGVNSLTVARNIRAPSSRTNVTGVIANVFRSRAQRRYTCHELESYRIRKSST